VLLTNRWAVLGLIFLIGLAIPMHFQAVAALAPYLIASGGLTYTDIGVLTGLFMAPGVFLAIPAGLLAARIGDKRTLLLGLVVMIAAALLFTWTTSYQLRFASRLLGGCGSVLLTVLMSKVITDWFIGREIATAQAVIASSFGFGVGIAMAVLPGIAQASSWSFAMGANTAATVVAALLLLVFFQDKTPLGTIPTGQAGLSWNMSVRETALSAIAGSCRGLFASGYVLFMSFLPPLLIAQGMTAVRAGALTSLTALVSIFSVPFGGFLSDRTGRPDVFIVFGAIGAAMACALVPYIAPPVLWIVCFGLLRGGCTGGIMAMPARVLRPESRHAGFAVASALYFIAMAAFPPIGGLLLDATRNPAVPLLFAATLWLMIPVMLAVFLLLRSRWVTRPA